MTTLTLAPPELLGLLALMRDSFAEALAHPDPAIADEAARVLDALPAGLDLHLAAELDPRDHACLAQLPEAATAAGRDWARALGPIAGRLPWRYGYAPRADAPDLGQRMAWAEIVGPAAPIRSDRVGFGLTFIGRDTFYPPHRHPAVELYGVVSGTALWTLEGETRHRPPGAFVLHRENAEHAMRTAAEPLLAIYSWTGDILSPTVYSDLPAH